MAKFSTSMRCCAAPALALIVLCPRPAAAMDVPDVEVAAKVGGGTPSPWVQENPLAFGFGARAGASWHRKLYVGLSVVDYLGETDTVQTGSWSSCQAYTGVAGSCTLSRVQWHSVQVGVEGGYGFDVRGAITLRPQLGAGDLVIIADGNAVVEEPTTSVVVAPATTHHAYLEPGMTVLFPLHPFFLGIDVNALWLVRDTTSSVVFTGHVQLGVVVEP